MTIEITRKRKSYLRFRSGRRTREEEGLRDPRRVAHPVFDDTHVLIDESPGKKMSPDTFQGEEEEGNVLARTPSTTCNLFRQLSKRNEELSRPLSKGKGAACMK